jgi:hypothetical protein
MGATLFGTDTVAPPIEFLVVGIVLVCTLIILVVYVAWYGSVPMKLRKMLYPAIVTETLYIALDNIYFFIDSIPIIAMLWYFTGITTVLGLVLANAEMFKTISLLGKHISVQTIYRIQVATVVGYIVTLASLLCFIATFGQSPQWVRTVSLLT